MNNPHVQRWTGPRLSPMGASFRTLYGGQEAPSPSPLPPGERVLRTPSLDGRGKGEGDKPLISIPCL